MVTPIPLPQSDIPDSERGRLPHGKRPLSCGGRYWDRTSDLFGVNNAFHH
jgi:hypothetical protein